MNINAAFPTKYVAAADLAGQPVNCTIARVEMENVGNEGESEYKPVVYFAGMKKGLVLNKTNATAIADAYGEETDAWANRPIVLYPTETDFRGKMTACIRVRIPASPPAPAAPTAPAPAAPPTPPTPPGPIAF